MAQSRKGISPKPDGKRGGMGAEKWFSLDIGCSGE